MPLQSDHVGPQSGNATKVSGTLILWVIGVFFVIGAFQAATQYFAYAVEYHPFVVGRSEIHLYPPWSIIAWSPDWFSRYPDKLTTAWGLALFVVFVGFLAVIVVKMLFKNTAKAYERLHGSARWAERADIESAGLLQKKSASAGVYVGGWVDKKGNYHYLRHNGPEHVLTLAPTRSGKGVGPVLITLNSWEHSVFVTDLKGELWELSAGWRQAHAGNKVLRFEPASRGSVHWNPLDEIRLDSDYAVGDVQNLVTLIVDPDGKGLESHWQKTAFALLVGVILHVLYMAKNGDSPRATLPLVDSILSDPSRSIRDLWQEMKNYHHINGKSNPIVGMAAQDMLDRPDEEAGSVLSTAKSYLTLYRDPTVAKNIGDSDFLVSDLMNRNEPVSLYVVTSPDDKTRLRPLVRIMVAMVIRRLAGKMTFEKGQQVITYKHRLLMMLDEFPSLGKIEILQESLAFLAGYGIKCYLICQDINQLRSREIGYGADESITSNCHVQNAFAPNRIETAEHLSKLTGNTTVVKEQITTSGNRAAIMLGHVSRTLQEVQRALLTPDECLRMPGAKKNAEGKIEVPGDMLIYVAGYPAIYGKQMLYFKDPVFSARAAVSAPEKSDCFTPQPETLSFENVAEMVKFPVIPLDPAMVESLAQLGAVSASDVPSPEEVPPAFSEPTPEELSRKGFEVFEELMELVDISETSETTEDSVSADPMIAMALNELEADETPFWKEA